MGYEWVTAPGLGDAGRVVVVRPIVYGGDRTIIGTDSDHRKAVYPMGLPVNNNFFRLTSCCIGRRVCVYEPYRRRISGGFVRLVAVTKHNRTQATGARTAPASATGHRVSALLAYRRHHIRATVLSRHRVARVPRRHPSARGAAPPRGIIRTWWSIERRPLLGHTRWCGHGCGAGQRGTWSWHSLVEKLTSARS